MSTISGQQSAQVLSLSAGECAAWARSQAERKPAGGVLWYALGGGAGHLTRSLAVARHFRRLSPEPAVILANSPFVRQFLPAGAPWDMGLAACAQPAAIHPSGTHVLHLMDSPGHAGLAQLVHTLVTFLKPRVLVVDAFPAGILGELAGVLPLLRCRRVAVLRRLQPRWVERWRLAELLAAAYDAVAFVEPGAGVPGIPSSVSPIETPPVLVRDAEELLAPSEARRRLGATDGTPVVLAAATGTRPAERLLPGVVRRLVGSMTGGGAHFRAAEPLAASPGPDAVSHYPLLEWMPGIDVVIGACGYNLCHETDAAGVPAIFVPQRRLYDDQEGRARGRRVARSPAELEQHLRAVLGERAAPRSVPRYRNGAADVARLLVP